MTAILNFLKLLTEVYKLSASSLYPNPFTPPPSHSHPLKLLGQTGIVQRKLIIITQGMMGQLNFALGDYGRGWRCLELIVHIVEHQRGNERETANKSLRIE